MMKMLDILQRILLRFSRYESFPNQFLLSVFASKESKAFTTTHLKFSPIVSRILRRKSPRADLYILDRDPKLIWTTEIQPRIKLDQSYTPEGEIRIDNKPYIALYKSIQNVLKASNARSILDIGCTSGNLLELVKNDYSNIEVWGLEIFEFLKMAAPSELQERILIRDLRNQISDKIKSDVTICLEVAEHIDPGYLDNFLLNVSNLTNKFLIMSWSTSFPGPDAPPQHISPVWKFQYKKIMKAYGFEEEKKLTNSLKRTAEKEASFHRWWLSTITVWSKTEKVEH
jgi:hypothetical protein